MKKLVVAFTLLAFAGVAGSAFALRYYSPAAPDAAPAPAVEPAAPTAAVSTGNCGGARCGAGSTGGCCGGAGSTAGATAARVEQIRTYLYDHFAREVGTEDLSVEVRDFGCHQEASIIQAGRTIKRYSISGSVITEIT